MAREYGATNNGFVAPTYAQIRAQREADLKAALRKRGVSDDIATDELSMFGRLINDCAAMGVALYDDFSELITQLDWDSADGPFAANLAHIRAGVSPLPARASTCTFSISGPNGLTIPAGTLFRLDTDDAVVFATDEAVVIAGGVGEAPTTATATGAVDATASSTNWTIVNTFTGWEGITQIENGSVTVGRDLETVEDLKTRAALATATGNATDAAIQAAVLEIMNEDDQVVVRANRTDATVDSIPAFQFEVLVWSADTAPSAAIAQAIWESQGTKRSYGTSSATVTDSTGEEQTISWTEADGVAVAARISDLETTGAPADAQDQIKAAVAAYIQGLNIGRGVKHFKAWQAAAGFSWVDDMTIEIRRSVGGTWGESDVAMGTREKATCTTSIVTFV